VYWNASPQGSILLMQELTSALNEERAPFRFKVVNDPRGYNRCDSAVLYLSRADYQRLRGQIALAWSRLESLLRPAVPAFTKALLPGLGLAEDPLEGGSFGMARCNALAEAITRSDEAFLEGEALFRSVVSSFEESGISTSTPYLNPGSRDLYETFDDIRRMPLRGGSRSGSQASNNLEAALTIGAALARSAIWAGTRCNWIGREPGSDITRRWTALPTDLYGGSAGVGLFLGELHAATADPLARRTALGAAKQVLDSMESRPVSRNGFYDGWTGALVAAARIGLLVGDEALHHKALKIGMQCVRRSTRSTEFDLISGRAGAIIGLLALYGLSNRSDFLSSAIQCGDRLMDSGKGKGRGLSWRSRIMRVQRDPTGLAHGAAGAGLALIELFHATGERRFLTASKRAFAYENRWLDSEEGNWIDFRLEDGESRSRKKWRSFATEWCHGAPGIALSRIRAYEITADPLVLADVRTAQRTLERTLESDLLRGGGDLCLCHGLAGRAEILWHVERATSPLGEPSEMVLQAASQVETGSFASADSPSLMLGSAGQGYFLIRLARPSTPSVLLPRPASFRDIPPGS
jgi:hypothetical protein